MIKKFLIVLLLSSAATIACADEYLYVENPDPNKYEMTWYGPGPNCFETSGEYQTKGWIFHRGGDSIVVDLIDKQSSSICIVGLATGVDGTTHFSHYLDCGDLISTSNTHWITMKGHKSYRTWACG